MKKFLSVLLSAAMALTVAMNGVTVNVAADTAEEVLYDVQTLTVVCPPNNEIALLWTVPNVEVANQYTYNVYLNNVLVETTAEKSVILTGVYAGGNVVTVKTVLNGVESTGVTKYALVREETSSETTETTETTEATEAIETSQENVPIPETSPMCIIPEETSAEVPVTSKAYICTYPTTAQKELLEVIGLVTLSDTANTVNVVWGQDAERMQAGYTYNVYVNGEKELSNVGCAYYTINNVDAGTAKITVTAVLDGTETTGVTQTVDVKGQMTDDEAVTDSEVKETTSETTTEIEVATEMTTEVETETAKEAIKDADAMEPETSTKTEVNPAPLEVIGLVATAPLPNTVNVVWGQDQARMDQACKYNVYVNGELKLEQVACADYTINNVEMGQAQITVKAVVDGVESEGVSKTVSVSQTVYEVSSVMVVCTPGKQVTAVWNLPQGVDTTGYAYNVYLNGQLVVENTTDTAVTFTAKAAGANVVTVKSVYLGTESAGISKYALVRE